MLGIKAADSTSGCMSALNSTSSQNFVLRNFKWCFLMKSVRIRVFQIKLCSFSTCMLSLAYDANRSFPFSTIFGCTMPCTPLLGIGFPFSSTTAMEPYVISAPVFSA